MFDLKKSSRQRCDGLDPKHGKKMCRAGTAGIERSCSFTVLSSALPMVRLFVPVYPPTLHSREGGLSELKCQFFQSYL